MYEWVGVLSRIEIVLLGILAMITLAVSQSKDAFFKNWVFPIPEGKGKTESLFLIGDTDKSIFTPMISA
jgi:hypothetical protein